VPIVGIVITVAMPVPVGPAVVLGGTVEVAVQQKLCVHQYESNQRFAHE